jgi:hypothetical protein
MKARWTTIAGVREDLQRIGIVDWPGVLGFFLLAELDVARFPGTGSTPTTGSSWNSPPHAVCWSTPPR